MRLPGNSPKAWDAAGRLTFLQLCLMRGKSRPLLCHPQYGRSLILIVGLLSKEPALFRTGGVPKSACVPARITVSGSTPIQSKGCPTGLVAHNQFNQTGDSWAGGAAVSTEIYVQRVKADMKNDRELLVPLESDQMRLKWRESVERS